MNSWFHNRQNYKSLDRDVALYGPKVDPENNWGNMTGYGSDGGCANGALAPLLSEAVHFKRYATKLSGK